MENQVGFTVRLNLNNTPEKQAWERLQSIDRTQYRSYSAMIVKAINSMFEDKSDVDMLAEIQATIRQEISKLQVANIPENQSQTPPPTMQEDELSIALDFADSF